MFRLELTVASLALALYAAILVVTADRGNPCVGVTCEEFDPVGANSVSYLVGVAGPFPDIAACTHSRNLVDGQRISYAPQHSLLRHRPQIVVI